MTVTNKRYSYPRVTAIQIDVHPIGENQINTSHTSHTQSVYGPRPRGQRITTFHKSLTDLDGSHCSQEKGPLTQSSAASRPIHGYVPSFSPKPTNEVVGLRQASIDDKLLCLLAPYHQHTIGTFNTCSQRSTHRSLIDTGRSYNLEDASFPHITPQPSQPTVSPFHLRVPPCLQFNH
jgi:hypothetical protein